MKDVEINSEIFHNSSARIVIFLHFFLLEIGKEKTQMIVIIIIMTLLDNTITGRTSSSHCGPLKLQIQIAKIRSKNTVKN